MPERPYDPWDVYRDTDREWKEWREKKNAAHEVGTKSDDQHEEAVREKKGEVGILCQHEQKEGGIESLAQVEKRRPGRPRKV